MASSLSSFVNNLAGEIHKIKCKYEHIDKKCETCGIKYKDCDWFFEYTNFKYDLVEYKCLCCNKNYKTTGENLEKQFFNNKILSISLFYCCKKVFIHMNT